MEAIESGILGGQEQSVAEMIQGIARMELGETSGKVSTAGRWETWWWNQEVQEKLRDKRKAIKAWDTIRDDASKLACKTEENKLRKKWHRQETRHTRNCMKNWKQKRRKMSCSR